MGQTAEVIDIPPPAPEAEKALSVSDQAATLIISDKPSYELGRELLLTIKDLRKEIGDTFKPIIERAHAAHKEALSQQKRIEQPLIEAEVIVKTRIGAFLAEEERKRQAEENRLRKIAEAEAAERQLADALAAEAEGDHEGAEEILDEPPAFVPPPIVPKTVQTGGGISMRETWAAEVTDLMQLVRAVAAGTVPINALMANMVFLGQQARSLKQAMRYPGVRAYPQNSIAAGRR